MNKIQTGNQSQALFAKAQHYMPGGVNSPVRAFKAVGGTPPIISKGSGAYLTDVDGNTYIDYVGSWGPLILGHAHPRVLNAIVQAAQQGTSFGAPCEAELRLSQLICQLMPSIEKIRLVNSGTEATMTAIRLARGYTGRNKIIKFEGCYHGHCDSLLVKAGSGALTLGTPSSAGIPDPIAAETLVADFNNLDSVTALFEKHGADIAGIIIEPIAGNMNFVPATQAFLSGLRQLCDQHKSLLIFDEVMSGFRVGLNGAQGLYSITPDLTTLGKVIGGGMPIGALGGKADIMDELAPLGSVYQAGTLSGNPVCMAAGLATLEEIQRPGFFAQLEQTTQHLTHGLSQIAQQHEVAFSARSAGGMFGLYFSPEENINSYQAIMRCDKQQFNRFFHGMLNEGVYLAPSAFEAGFVSSAHGKSEIDKTFHAAEKCLQIKKLG